MNRVKNADANFIAAILAIGLALAINLIIFGVVWNTISNDASVLSENATYVLLTCFGGIIALLGSSIGYMFGQREANSEPAPPEFRQPAWGYPGPQARPFGDEQDTEPNRPDGT